MARTKKELSSNGRVRLAIRVEHRASYPWPESSTHPARRPGWCDAMRRNYHRHCQGRFTRLASLARSLTVPAAAGLLLVIAVPLVIMPMPAQAQGKRAISHLPGDI